MLSSPEAEQQLETRFTHLHSRAHALSRPVRALFARRTLIKMAESPAVTSPPSSKLFKLAATDRKTS